jgi:hypothetical protein
MFGQECVEPGVVVVLGVVVVELPVVVVEAVLAALGVVVEPPVAAYAAPALPRASAAPATAIRCLPVIAPPSLVTSTMEAGAPKASVGGS